MDKVKVYDYLKELNIWHEITEHQALYDMDALTKIELPYPESMAKNLFVRDNKKRNFYLITVKGDKRIDLKDFRQKHNTLPLSFASETSLMEIMGLTPGSVTPFGILNDVNCRVKLFLDNDFCNGSSLIGIHPNSNTATVWLKVEDLIRIIQEHGNDLEMIDIV